MSSEENFPSYLVASDTDLPALREKHYKYGDATRLKGYNDSDRLWAAMLEWLVQFEEVANLVLEEKNIDVVHLVANQQAREAAE